MKRSRRKRVVKPQGGEDFSFPPPFQEQARFIELANTMLASDGTETLADQSDGKPNPTTNPKTKVKGIA